MFGVFCLVLVEQFFKVNAIEESVREGVQRLKLRCAWPVNPPVNDLGKAVQRSDDLFSLFALESTFVEDLQGTKDAALVDFGYVGEGALDECDGSKNRTPSFPPCGEKCKAISWSDLSSGPGRWMATVASLQAAFERGDRA